MGAQCWKTSLCLLESLEELELYLDKENMAIIHTLSVKIQMLQFIFYAIPFSFSLSPVIHISLLLLLISLCLVHILVPSIVSWTAYASSQLSHVVYVSLIPPSSSYIVELYIAFYGK